MSIKTSGSFKMTFATSFICSLITLIVIVLLLNLIAKHPQRDVAQLGVITDHNATA
jgi:hypothetical protein